MKSYRDVFSELGNQKRAALIPFFVVGDPDFDTSIADGPTIQKADIRAVRSGMNMHKALDFIKEIKAYKDIPTGLLMYYNLICHYGIDTFFQDFHAAGVNSVLVADLSIDDADEVLGPAGEAGLDSVFMVTPNTTTERMQQIASKTTGFIYTVSLLGVTGSRTALSETVEGLIGQLKGLTSVPVCHARAVADAGADGVIIGSRIVGIIEANLGDRAKMIAEITAFLTEVKTTLAASG